MNDKDRIPVNIELCGSKFKLSLRREEESAYRHAAVLIKTVIERYQSEHPGSSVERALTATLLLYVANAALEKKEDDKISDELRKTLDKIDNIL